MINCNGHTRRGGRWDACIGWADAARAPHNIGISCIAPPTYTHTHTQRASKAWSPAAPPPPPGGGGWSCCCSGGCCWRRRSVLLLPLLQPLHPSPLLLLLVVVRAHYCGRPSAAPTPRRARRAVSPKASINQSINQSICPGLSCYCCTHAPPRSTIPPTHHTHDPTHPPTQPTQAAAASLTSRARAAAPPRQRQRRAWPLPPGRAP
jgi:hypothetical protein